MACDTWSFYAIVEAAPAWYVRPSVALTGHIVTGPVIEVSGTSAHPYAFVGRGLGIFTHL